MWYVESFISNDEIRLKTMHFWILLKVWELHYRKQPGEIDGVIKELIKNEQNNAFKTHRRICTRETLSRKRTQKIKRWLIFYQFSKLSYSNNSKRWYGPLPSIKNGTKLHHAHMTIHKESCRWVQLHPWFGINSNSWRQGIQDLPNIH